MCWMYWRTTKVTGHAMPLAAMQVVAMKTFVITFREVTMPFFFVTMPLFVREPARVVVLVGAVIGIVRLVQVARREIPVQLVPTRVTLPCLVMLGRVFRSSVSARGFRRGLPGTGTPGRYR